MMIIFIIENFIDLICIPRELPTVRTNSPEYIYVNKVGLLKRLKVFPKKVLS